jgi:hypothetical protein
MSVCQTHDAIDLEREDLFPDWSENGVVTLRLTPSGEAKARKALKARLPLMLEIDPKSFLTPQATRSGS